MNNVTVDQFAKHIALEGKINEDDAKKILKALDIQKLKAFLKSLKKYQEREIITVLSSDTLDNTTKKELESFFNGKSFKVEIDPKIGAGIKVKTYDMIYDLTVKGKLEKLANELEEN